MIKRYLYPIAVLIAMLLSVSAYGYSNNKNELGAFGGPFNNVVQSPSLGSLSDTTITSASVDEILEYNGSKWVNVPNEGGSGGGVSVWATTSDNLAIYPATETQVVIVGANATTTDGVILEVIGNIAMSEYLRHGGDTDTYLRFTGDQINLDAGGVQFLEAVEGASDILKVNDGGADVDFQVKGLSEDNLIYANAGTDRVGIANAGPAYTLDVTGDINFTGTLYDNGVEFGGAGLWEETVDSLAINPITDTQVVIVGSSATSSTGAILDVTGDSYFDGDLLVKASNGRIWGITGFTGGQTVHFYYGGDSGNQIQTTYGGEAQYRAYWGSRFYVNSGEVARFGTSHNELDSYFIGKLGVGTTSPTEKLSVDGNVLADGYLEYSKKYDGDALDVIKNITCESGTKNGDWCEIDHNTLPDGVKYEKDYTVQVQIGTTTEKQKVKDKNGKDTEEEIDVDVPIYQDEITHFVGRDLGNSVQFNLKAIQELLERVEMLESELNKDKELGVLSEEPNYSLVVSEPSLLEKVINFLKNLFNK